MNKKDVLKIFKDANALLEGHFLLSSGLHSQKYLQCAQVLSYPNYAKKLCGRLASKFKNKKIDVVVGPAYGGIIVAYELAHALGAKALFTERKDSIMQLRRGFKIEKAQRVLVAEDVVTTGKSVKEVLKLLKRYRPKIVSVVSLIDRSGTMRPFGNVAFTSLAKINIATYKKKSCPLCKKRIPLVKPGSRKKA